MSLEQTRLSIKQTKASDIFLNHITNIEKLLLDVSFLQKFFDVVKRKQINKKNLFILT